MTDTVQRWVVAGCALACGLSILIQSSFWVGDSLWFCLFDDAMISMRYARNMVDGVGFVWNGGEYVEGVTNPLWTVYMAVWHLFGIPDNMISLPIQLTGLCIFVTTALWGFRIGGLIAGVCISLYYPLAYWSVIGMETGLVALLILLSWSFLQKNPVLSYLILAIGAWVRLDIALCFIPALWFGKDRLKGALILISSVGIQEGGRLLYFHEWLPNTYYLKVGGQILHRVEHGLQATLKFLAPLGILLYYVRQWSYGMIVCLMFIAYSIWVGGDAWDWWHGGNRFMVSIMPLLFVMIGQKCENSVL